MPENPAKLLETEIERLQVLVATQANEIEQLKSKIAELEHRVGRNSKNSSLPPSSDSIRDKADATKNRAERRAAAKAARKEETSRKRGKQPGELVRRCRTVQRSDACCRREWVFQLDRRYTAHRIGSELGCGGDHSKPYRCDSQLFGHDHDLQPCRIG